MVYSRKFPNISKSIVYAHYEPKRRRLPKDCHTILHPNSVRMGSRELKRKRSEIEKKLQGQIIPFIGTNVDNYGDFHVLMDGGVVEVSSLVDSYIRLYHNSNEGVKSLARKLDMPNPIIRKGNS